jgi:hypothetical protein
VCVTPQQAQRRVKANGFRINGDIYVKPDRLRKWLSHRDRVVLKEAGVLRTRRDDAATVEQAIAGIPGKPRYYVLDGRKWTGCPRRSRPVLERRLGDRLRSAPISRLFLR